MTLVVCGAETKCCYVLQDISASGAIRSTAAIDGVLTPGFS